MLISLRRALALVLLLLAAPALAASSVNTGHVRAELVAYAPDGIVAGKPLWLGVRMEHAAGWHSYWVNPGDSGLATTFDWTLPKGIAAGAIEWPAPRRIPLPPLMNFGYSGTVLLPVPVTISRSYAGGPLKVALVANWLVCEVQCIPETATLDLVVPAGPSGDQAAFEAAWSARPVTLAGAKGLVEVKDGALRVRVTGLPETLAGTSIAILPEVSGLIDNAAPVTGSWADGAWTGAVAMLKTPDPVPATLPAVLLVDGGDPGAIRVALAKGTVPAPAASAPPSATFAWALLGALVGGMILNLMPCVFPILSLKVLGIARHGGERKVLVRSGIAYSLGVILSFVALAGVLLALRAGGEQLGWGFQLQSAGFVAALAVLFFVIGLNLAGYFEVGTFLPSGIASARASNPTTDSFLTGVLAVAVASPCTAPFMGASIGLAATLPAAQALLLFAVLGVGMALPFLLVSLVPAVARAMPRPGLWMEHFRNVMAFPMFATVVWLLWVIAQTAGPDAVAVVLFAMVGIGFAIWLWKVARGRWSAPLRIAAIMLLAGAAWQVGQTLAAPAPTTAVAGSGEWKPWSRQEVTSLTTAGKPVFVDFTAAWCVTCQFNKRTVLHDPQVAAAFEHCGIARMEADWTRRDPAITGALAAFGRNGVPVYALYAGSGAPVLLSEVLSKSEVLGALARVPGCKLT